HARGTVSNEQRAVAVERALALPLPRRAGSDGDALVHRLHQRIDGLDVRIAHARRTVARANHAREDCPATERRHPGGWRSGILPLRDTRRLAAAPPAGWQPAPRRRSDTP